MTHYRKILIGFADNTELITILSDLARFEQILYFSKIDGTLT